MVNLFIKKNNVPRQKESYQGIIITEHFTNLPKYAKTKSNNSNIYNNSNSQKETLRSYQGLPDGKKKKVAL